eukprot:CAMPEP_0177284516 /NCGR_PEP_ID=MMETSP0367-20130122/72565_1 /TAXON_ID=447022 ORGANISM="Scrippsiella hangoei-like, Strain SHHI-4" /NCGR_SAMPLE_ID=MMETSP0367 /ASSEMBLY_ACC=CAM_ASM_000362 /LENGTH=120 /DNA_ID=CAMNT_0018741569 /DNA_START=371 /DNA_END=731 /DNA_ORIENTATION=+
MTAGCHCDFLSFLRLRRSLGPHKWQKGHSKTATWLLPSKGARLAAAHAVGPRPLSGHLGAAKISSFSTSAKRNTGSAMAPESVTSAKRGPNLSLSGQAWGDEGPESVTLYGESAGGSGGS